MKEYRRIGLYEVFRFAVFAGLCRILTSLLVCLSLLLFDARNSFACSLRLMLWTRILFFFGWYCERRTRSCYYWYSYCIVVHAISFCITRMFCRDMLNFEFCPIILVYCPPPLYVSLTRKTVYHDPYFRLMLSTWMNAVGFARERRGFGIVVWPTRRCSRDACMNEALCRRGGYSTPSPLWLVFWVSPLVSWCVWLQHFWWCAGYSYI